MQAEDLVLDDGGQREEVEQLGELLPYVGVSILAQAFIIKTVPKSSNKGKVRIDTLRQ